MEKHTPEPWVIDNTQVKTSINTRNYPKDGKHIAMVNFGGGFTKNDYISDEEHIANCKLIANAPLLYKGCKKALKALDAIGHASYIPTMNYLRAIIEDVQ